MDMKRTVVGGTHQRFIAWCKDQGISPNRARYVGNDIHRVMGLELKESDVVRLGGTTPEMEQYLRARIR